MNKILATQLELRIKLLAKIDGLKLKYRKFRDRLSSKLNPLKFVFGQATPDIIVAQCEVNNRQGVGILLSRLFPNSKNIFSLRSRNLYDGRQKFGFAHVCINHSDETPEAVNSKVFEVLRLNKAKRILSIPYYADDVLSSLALKELLKVPLCTYLMDDQNICVPNIPDDHMRSLLERSDLRLGISRELCQAYEQKYGLKFWFLPPVVDADLIQIQPSFPLEHLEVEHLEQVKALPSGVLIGNIWSQQWLDRLRALTRQTEVTVDWYGNPNRSWLSFDEKSLQEDGIFFKGFYPKGKLVKNLRKAPYAIILTGSSDDNHDRPELARLSLPSRIPYLVAAANIPLIVVGSRDTAAARFVKDMDLGVVCDYSPDSFSQAILDICSSHRQHHFRQRAAYLASSLSSENMAAWIWRSLERKQPINLRFEQLGTVLSDASVVITAFEINRLHGTGPLVKRIVEGTPNILSIHSMDMYDGEHDFGDLSLFISHNGLSRSEARQNVIRSLGENTIRQILCVPYRPDDLITAIYLSELHNAPLGTYIMDDQNICVNNISDSLMQEFLSKCSLRLATHPELRDAYEAKFNLKFWLLPAVVPDVLASKTPHSFEWAESWANSGILLGSIWSRHWFDMLCKATKEADVKLDWCGTTQYPWLSVDSEDVRQWGISLCGLLPEIELADKLKHSAFVIVPTGTMDERDDRKELSRLSLPGRIIFALVTSNTPIIVLGHQESPAAKFVKRFKVGVVCDYDGESLRSAVNHVTNPEVQRKMRQHAASVASRFSAKDINQWLWNSIELGRLSDLRFEELFADIGI